MNSTLRFLDRAIRQPVREGGACAECSGTGSATTFSDFPCATCGGSGFVEADDTDDAMEQADG